MNITLHYDSHERYFATDAAMMADNASLVQEKTAASPPGLAGLAPVRAAGYLDWKGRGYAKDVARLMPRYGHVGYVHEVEGWAQLWLFSLYNDKAFLGFGLHEGDWEMVQWHEDGRCVFGQHRYGMRAEWTGHVYVARGSHALYPKPGRFRAPVVPDVCDGAAPAVTPSLREFGPWAAWPGRWGSTEARNEFESMSPESPLCQRRGKDPEWFWREAENLRRKVLG